MKKFYQITNKSFKELGVQTHKDLWDKVKGEYKGLSACIETKFTKAEGSDNKFTVVMSTATVDRHGDIVEQNWDLKNFKKNPVLLDSHNYSSIEHILGKVNKIKVSDGKLVGEIEFALDNPKGLLAYKMALGGFLNATSVGFIPLEFNEQGNITKSELLEDSIVSVPANPEALFEKSVKEIGEALKEAESEEDDEEVDEEVDEEKEPTEADLEGIEADVEEDEPVNEEVKTVKPSKKEIQIKAIKSLREDLEKREAKKQKNLKQALEIIKSLGEIDQKEQVKSCNSVKTDRAMSRRKINKAIRLLLSAK